MNKIGNWFFAAVMSLAAMVASALAVTVDVGVVSNGEPVPGATVSFETGDGVSIPPVQSTSETPPQPAEGAAEAPPPGKPAESEAPSHTVSTVLPDEVIGKPLTVIISKDGKVVKREPLTVSGAETKLSVEAYDPADASLSLDVSRPGPCDAGSGCDLAIEISNEGAGIYEGPVFLVLRLPGLGQQEIQDSTGEMRCAAQSNGDSLCRISVSLEPLKQLSLTVPVKPAEGKALPPKACALLLGVDAGNASSRSLLKTVQLGLLLQGAALGAIDGKPGPKTKSAMAELGFAPDTEIAVLQADAFTRLFGKKPDAVSRLRLDAQEACAVLREGKVTSKKVTSSKTVKKPVTAKTKPRDNHKPRTTAKSKPSDSGVGIGIGIGIGVGTDMLRHKKKHGSDDDHED